MRVLVSADMEGVSGVVHPDDVEPGTVSYAEFRHVMTSDVNAAIAGLFDAGASQVVVNDAHYTMRNLVVTDLDPRVTYIRGSQKPLGMIEGLLDDRGQPAVDAVAFVGYHAGAGQPGVLAHCHLGNSITGVRFGGAVMSEGRMNAAVAAEFGVPLVLVTGDDITCADARAYAPGVSTAQVKRAITRYTAHLESLSVAQARIRAAAAAGLAARPAPATVLPPFEIEVDFDAAHLADAAVRLPGVRRSSHLQVVATGTTMLEAYQIFRLVALIAATATVNDWG